MFGLSIPQLYNPADFLGIPNTYGISAIYYGTPLPPPTPISLHKSKFKWVLYARKLRNRREGIR